MANPSPATPQRTFLITGAASGFGRAFTEAALANGHRVAATVRNTKAAAELEAIAPGLCKAIVLDVTDFTAIEPAVAEIESGFGPIDVLINNAGYGHEGILEESPLDELIHQFQVNVFGAVAMTRAVLPGMRTRRSGHIINITSMGGYITMPGISYYCGSKFALEGISEVLAAEVAAFGVIVTAIAPGSFRTDWAGRSMVRSERSISDYDALFGPIRAGREEKSGHQAGDPARAAQVMLDLVAMENPPVHLLLGNDAVDLVKAKLANLSHEIETWEAISRSTNFRE